jgi:hypothetical protein
MAVGHIGLGLGKLGHMCSLFLGVYVKKKKKKKKKQPSTLFIFIFHLLKILHVNKEVPPIWIY